VAQERAVAFIEGDGVGSEIHRATRPVLEAALRAAYGPGHRIRWVEVLAGRRAQEAVGQLLPLETLQVIRECGVCLKGPLETPVGGGYRSLNVTLRQELDLYACIRPVRWFPGLPSPLRHPERVDMVVVRENTEDVYCGLEWEAGSPECRRVLELLHREVGVELRPDVGLGLKPISELGTKRLVRRAIRWALEHDRRRLTVVHKGNIMKYTEGAFLQWAYEVARQEFSQEVCLEGEPREARLLMGDRLADNMFQQILLRPGEYDVLVAPNLNGDYLSDALAAMVGGLGVAPSANLGDELALFEAAHGTAPKYAGRDLINPTSLILAGTMMLEHLGWPRAAAVIQEALGRLLARGVVTQDLGRQMEGAQVVGCREFSRRLQEEILRGP